MALKKIRTFSKEDIAEIQPDITKVMLGLPVTEKIKILRQCMEQHFKRKIFHET